MQVGFDESRYIVLLYSDLSGGVSLCAGRMICHGILASVSSACQCSHWASGSVKIAMITISYTNYYIYNMCIYLNHVDQRTVC